MGNLLNRKKEQIDFIKKTGTPYKNIKYKIKPLDLVVFRGGEVVSDAISALEQFQLGSGDWTHTGLIIDTTLLPSLPNGKSGKLYVLESTMSGKLSADGLTDVEGNSVFGVQIRDMKKVVKAYNTAGTTLVGWCRLKNNPYLQLPGETIDNYENRMLQLSEDFTNIYDKYGHKTYDYNPLSLLASLFPWFRCLRDKFVKGDDKLFCSELIALVYCKLGILDENEFNYEDVVPVDFTSGLDQDGIKPFHKLPPIILI